MDKYFFEEMNRFKVPEKLFNYFSGNGSKIMKPIKKSVNVSCIKNKVITDFFGNNKNNFKKE